MHNIAALTAVFGYGSTSHPALVHQGRFEKVAAAGYFGDLLNRFNELDPNVRSAIIGGAGLGGLGALSGLFAPKGEKGRASLSRGALGALVGAGGGYFAPDVLSRFMPKEAPPAAVSAPNFEGKPISPVNPGPVSPETVFGDDWNSPLPELAGSPDLAKPFPPVGDINNMAPTPVIGGPQSVSPPGPLATAPVDLNAGAPVGLYEPAPDWNYSPPAPASPSYTDPWQQPTDPTAPYATL